MARYLAKHPHREAIALIEEAARDYDRLSQRAKKPELATELAAIRDALRGSAQVLGHHS